MIRCDLLYPADKEGVTGQVPGGPPIPALLSPAPVTSPALLASGIP